MASQDHEKAMDGLLRRSLARDTAAKADCPDAELLAAYYERSLGADEVAGYDLHFSQCTRCREQLAAMSRAHAALVAEVEIPAEPVFAGSPAIDFRQAAVLAGAAGPKQAESRAQVEVRRRPKMLELRWLAPVAAVIIFAVVVYVRFMPRQANLAINRGAAMSQQPPAPEPQREPEPARAAPEASGGTAPVKTVKKATGAPSAAKAGRPSQPTSAPMHGRAATATAGRGGTVPKPALASEASPTAPAEAQSAAPEFADKNAEAEPVQAAPPPEMKASMPSAEIATESADARKPAERASHSETSGSVSSFGLAQKRAAGTAAGGRANSAPKAKSASPRSAPIVIQTPDSNVLYRIASRGYIERSEDAGVTWQGQHVNAAAEFTAGSAPAPNVCWLVGRAGVIFFTDDGKNWRTISPPAASDLASVSAKDALSATVTTGDGKQWSTHDRGETWNPEN